MSTAPSKIEAEADLHVSAVQIAHATPLNHAPTPPPAPRSSTLAPRPSSPVPVLVFEQVSKWYGPVLGVNQVTLELRPGITGLVGPNGAGKSTLLRLAAGLMRPDIGRVQVNGIDCWSASAKRAIGYCPDNDRFYEELSGRQFVEIMAKMCGYSRKEARRRAISCLERVGMIDRCNRRLRGYSKGMRQRIKLAQALIHDPQLLILDEPLSGVDPIGRQESLELFRGLATEGKCLLISSHELDELEKLTDHVAILAHGRIGAVGTLAKIRDLLDQHPMAVRIDCDRPRQLAQDLVALESVVGVEHDSGATLTVQARNSRRFFDDLTTLVLEENFQIEHLETLDDSAGAILGYVLGK